MIGTRTVASRTRFTQLSRTPLGVSARNHSNSSSHSSSSSKTSAGKSKTAEHETASSHPAPTTTSSTKSSVIQSDSSSTSPGYSATILSSQTTPNSATSNSASAITAAPRRPPTIAEKEVEALRRLEERFGGAHEAQLGELDEHGRPRGMAKYVSGNLFRLI
ncbi:hypothetical protein MVLG_03246 [Microbotryum lychnidis-dioicae p1A1 Lamole]|uniref:Uncharacterized protein n=1 Tax=Microbotryum lychnidis-dioicae (strain p1A1 Lamole / MvSl-1064) TaxID=683840 RepID=U5H7M1_USTV1|nr:hypothetical protein MVLG_03246 [Microbotryum lychnidis-dioicae p1A1 Lamole]|eukprot:KDE06462.1 hypothetical protein MVLG_03246 [Microbotryum lychnidis-dioicae p1A1 Lamole]